MARPGPYVTDVRRYFGDVYSSDRRALFDAIDTRIAATGIDPSDTDALRAALGAPAEFALRVRAEHRLSSDARALTIARRRHLRSFRTRDKVLTVAAVVVLAFAVSAISLLGTYQPLRFENGIATGGPQELRAGDRLEYRYSFVDGKTFAVGVWLANRGSLAVDVRAIDLPQLVTPWSNWRVVLGRDDDPGGSGEVTTPFQPFQLRPGHTRLVWFEGDFRGCPPAYHGGGMGVSGVEVRYRLFGWSHAKLLDLGFTYSVRVDPACP